MRNSIVLTLCAALLAAPLGHARHLSAAAPDTPGSLAAFLAGQSQLSTTLEAMQSVGLTAIIDKATAGFSFLAPTDDAWEAFGQAYNLTTEDVLALPYLRGILMYATSTESTDTLTSGATLPTLFGQTIMVGGAASAGSVSTQSITGTVLEGQESSATVLAAPTLVDGKTWAYTVDAVLLPSLIVDSLSS